MSAPRMTHDRTCVCESARLHVEGDAEAFDLADGVPKENLGLLQARVVDHGHHDARSLRGAPVGENTY